MGPNKQISHLIHTKEKGGKGDGGRREEGQGEGGRRGGRRGGSTIWHNQSMKCDFITFTAFMCVVLHIYPQRFLNALGAVRTFGNTLQGHLPQHSISVFACMLHVQQVYRQDL